MTVGFVKQGLLLDWKFYVGIIIGIVFLYLAIRNTEFVKTIRVMENVLLMPILACLGLRTIALWTRGIRWKMILKQKKEVSSTTVFRILCIGEMGNYLLPARIGDVIRGMMMAKRENISNGFSLTSVFVDRLLDLLVVSILFAWFSLALAYPHWMKEVGYWAGSALVIVVIGCFVLLWGRDRIKRSTKTMFSRVPKVTGKDNQLLVSLVDGLAVMRNWRQMIRATSMTFILWGIYSAAFYFVLLGLQIELVWYASVVAVTTVALGQTLPSTPGYVGTTEFFMVSVLTWFSVDRSTALACALVSHGLQYLVIVGIGLGCYLWENNSLGSRRMLRTEGIGRK